MSGWLGNKDWSVNSCTSVYLTKPKWASTSITAGLGPSSTFVAANVLSSLETKQIQTLKVQQGKFTRPSKKRQRQVGNKSLCPDLPSTNTPSSQSLEWWCTRGNHVTATTTFSFTAWTLNVFFFSFAPFYIRETARIQGEKRVAIARQLHCHIHRAMPEQSSTAKLDITQLLFLGGQTANF